MYTLTVKNNYSLDIGASTGVTIEKGKSFVFNKRGSLFLMIPGMAEMNFIDLGDHKLSGYPFPKETWGVLVRYSNIEAYYRYEGGGELTAVIDLYGSCTLTTTNGSMITISLPEFIIGSH